MKLRTDDDIVFWSQALANATQHLDDCRIHLDSLDAEREEIVDEMRQLELLIKHITPFTSEHPLDALEKFLIEYEPDPESGLADAVRRVLGEAQGYMTPIDIRDILDASKYDLTRHSNALASIHGILKRFDESGEVSSLSAGNKTSYRIARERKATGAGIKVYIPDVVPTLGRKVIQYDIERKRK